MKLHTLIKEGPNGCCAVTTTLRDDSGQVVAEKTEQFTCRAVAINVVTGLRGWAKERGIAIGVCND